MCEVSVVIPVRDEEKNITELTDRLFSVFKSMEISFEVIFVTDINRDNTENCLRHFSEKYPNVKSIKLSNSFGQHVAVLAGLDHCAGKYVVIMDGDLQDFPEDIPLLYNKIREGFDVVFTVKDRKNDSILRNFFSQMFNLIMNNFSDTKISGNTSMFRMISRKILVEVIKFREYEPSLTYIFSYINMPTTSVPVRSGTRQHGKTKYNFFKLIDFALSSSLSFSRKPIKMISNLGFIVSIFSFLYFVIVLLQYFFFKIEILGWATIITIVTFIGGIQLLSIGVIGEYIGRIYMQTKNRPLYIIEKKFGKFEQDPNSNTE
jgi:glycosyltransferase involved in cell wall biosynthesis